MKSAEKSVTLFIGGMTCINCQNKIEKKLKHTDGIINARVSYSTGTANISYNEKKITPERINDVIEKLGYKVLTKKGQQNPDIIMTIGLLAVIVLLYLVLQTTGILNLLVPGQLADTKMGYGMLFVIGLITSVHCIAMCGGINLSQCIPPIDRKQGESRKESPNMSKLSIFLPALSYNFGRVFSYTVFGFVLGLIGFLLGGDTETGLSALLQGILKMIAGFFMIIMGCNMLNLFPWLRKCAVHLPEVIVRKTGKARAKSSRPFWIGIVNGFMPCGPLQAMWIVALATANPFSGALSMFLFALGTVPLMLGLGSIVSALGKKFTDKVMTVGAVLVVTLGLAMLTQGVILSGLISSDLSSGAVQDNNTETVEETVEETEEETNEENVGGEEVQLINSTLSPGRYPDITVRAGIPVKWVIDAPEGSINGCNYKALIREYGIEYSFQNGENVIEFTPTEAGTVSYSCWMGMIRGTISVTDEG